ncbi:hypothetical protein TNCV_4233141 [Trichonephila clavipes]|nr:hypothetical protein TNCV_4233141 [Trichonephila clavipes]
MATGSYLTPTYSRSQSEVQGDLHKVTSQIEVHEVHRGKRLNSTPTISRSFEHRAADSMIRLDSTPTLRENFLEVFMVSHFYSLFTNLTRGLATRRLFRVPPCHKGPGFEPRPYSTATSVTNHYTG